MTGEGLKADVKGSIEFATDSRREELADVADEALKDVGEVSVEQDPKIPTVESAPGDNVLKEWSKLSVVWR